MDLIDHTAGLVPGPGFYRMPAAVYHADPSPEPSLSSSVALEILTLGHATADPTTLPRIIARGVWISAVREGGV